MYIVMCSEKSFVRYRTFIYLFIRLFSFDDSVRL